MSFSFDALVEAHHFLIRAVPHTDNRQKLNDYNISLSPAAPLVPSGDSFGNKYYYASIPFPHNFLNISVSGAVNTFPTAEEAYIPNERFSDLYRFPSRMTKMSDNLSALLRCAKLSPKMSKYEKTLALMRHVHSAMNYAPGTTTVDTTAAQAAEGLCGVCQDYAHIMLALLRAENIPARYCAGIVKGVGESHAWVEAYLKGYWYGFDPTHNLLVQTDYIKLAHGRDCSDCPITRGIFKNRANQSAKITCRSHFKHCGNAYRNDIHQEDLSWNKR